MEDRRTYNSLKSTGLQATLLSHVGFPNNVHLADVGDALEQLVVSIEFRLGGQTVQVLSCV